MSAENTFTFENFCDAIRMVSPCMDDYLYVYDLQNDRYYISPSALKRFCIPNFLFDHVEETHREFVHAEDYDNLIEDLGKMISGEKDEHNLVYRWLDCQRRPVWINCRGRVIRDERQHPRFMVGCINEIGRKPRADESSGLLTSAAVREFFDNTVNTVHKFGFIMCIVIDDLQYWSEKNGKFYTNYVMQEVANCIQEELAPNQKVYRLLSEQFIIVDYFHDMNENAEELYQRIRAAISRKIEKNEYQIMYTVSAGIVRGSDAQCMNYATMIQTSKFILERMRADGRNSIYYYQKEDYHRFLEAKQLLAEMKKAVLDDFCGFETYFQPIVERETLQLKGAECLLRYHSVDGRMISPNQFISILEESDLIIPVGKWIFDQAMRFCRECRSMVPMFKMHVNLSYIQIIKSNIIDIITQTLENYDLPTNSLVVELTESGHLESTAQVRSVWDELRRLGMLIAVDDFGTGYSNLSSIGMLLPNQVKLDRKFTVKAMKDPYERLLMKRMAELIHSLSLHLCIEGIETDQELALANEIGADFIQGFYYGKPCGKEQFLEQFVSTASKADPSGHQEDV